MPVVALQLAPTAVCELPVDINVATADQLRDLLPGAGTVLSERIVAWRGEHGPFSDPDALSEVPGVGERLLARWRPRLIAGGAHAPSGKVAVAALAPEDEHPEFFDKSDVETPAEAPGERTLPHAPAPHLQVPTSYTVSLVAIAMIAGLLGGIAGVVKARTATEAVTRDVDALRRDVSVVRTQSEEGLKHDARRLDAVVARVERMELEANRGRAEADTAARELAQLRQESKRRQDGADAEIRRIADAIRLLDLYATGVAPAGSKPSK